MDELRASVWKRRGQDRVYVNLPNRDSVAWLNRITDEVHILDERYRERALELLIPFMEDADNLPRAEISRNPSRSSVSLPPEVDLAMHRPGQLLQEKVDRHSSSFIRRLLAGIRRQEIDGESWRSGVTGEKAVGRELARLAPQGWMALHSIPLRKDVDLDHLLIGPGGVFCINTKNYPGKDVWVGDVATRVNYGPSRPLVRSSRTEARHVSRVLGRSCGFPVAVTPALVFVGIKKLDKSPTLNDVRAYRQRELAALGDSDGVLTAGQIQEIYTVARDKRNWVRV
jgi:hypothetical protein